jgi:UDP:flavonoid glycosyltransferase YjiC (YdhE family)
MGCKRIVHVGFGGGSGHIVRALSVLFGLKRAGVDCDFQLLCDSDFGVLAEPYCGVSWLKLQPELHLRDARRGELFLFINELDPDLLIVDGTWAPILPFIKYLRCPKVIIFRYYAEEWFSFRLPDGEIVSFDPSGYEAAFSTEPNFSRPGLASIDPLVIRNRNEILTRDEARKRLGAEDGKKLIVVAHNGFTGELEKIAAQEFGEGTEAKVVMSSNADGEGLFPLCDYAAGIDLLIAGAGYNSFYESAFFKIPTRFMPQERRGGEQAWRVRQNAGYSFDSNGADQLAKEIVGLMR